MFDHELGVRERRHQGTWVYWVFAAIVLVLTLATPSAAQVTTASVIGSVTDHSGAAVPDPKVEIVNTDTNLTRTVDGTSTGQYRFDLLPIGNYILDVTATGFKKYVQKGIVLTVNEIATVDVTMEIGSVNETVNVTGAPPTVNTGNAEIGSTIENQEVVNLPLVNRNAYQLLELVPGYQSGAFPTSEGGEAATTLGYVQQLTFFNGGSDGGAGSVAYFLDGGLNMAGLRNTGNSIPSPDAIEEFRVQTNDFSAAYGRTNGTIINIVTKSGTNDFHGSVFEFVRNTILNANTYDNPAATPPFHRNQFGGTVGGPVRKNKLFFFANYDGLRQITPTFENDIVVPFGSCGPPITTTCTATLGAERVGNFNTATTSPAGTPATNIKDPIGGGAAFTANQIPANMLDPSAEYIIANYIPIANEMDSKTGRMDMWDGFLNPTPNNFDEGIGKLSYQLTDKQSITGSYFFNQGYTQQPAGGNITWGNEKFAFRQQNLNLSHTWTISSDKINQIWASYTRNFGGRTDLPATSNSPNSLTAITAAACATSSPFYQAGPCGGQNYLIQGTQDLPSITVTNYFSLGEAISGPTAGTNFLGLRNVFSWTHGKHSFQFGGDISHDDDKQQTLLDNYGVWTFGNGSKNSGNNLSDFELGLNSALEQDAPVTPYAASYYYALFAQDDYRVTSRLTFNLGVRWDVQTPPTDSSNLASVYVPGAQSTVYSNAPLGLLVVGDKGVPPGIVNTRYHHVAPRLGIAWDPAGNGKTAIRAGFGVFYGSVSGNDWNATSNFEPFAIRLTPWPVLFASGNTPGNYPTLTNPYNGFKAGSPPATCIPFPFPNPNCGGAFTSGGSVENIAPTFQWPYTYELNFSAQHQFRGGFTLAAAYVGSLAHDLPFAFDENYPTTTCGPVTGSTFKTCSGGAGILDRRPVDNLDVGVDPSQFGQILQVQSSQHSSYNGLQITFSEILGRHLTLKGYYTFSQTLDSVQLDNNGTNSSIVQDMADLAEERGPGDFDMKHTFAASFVWQLDYYTGSSGILRWIANGWSVSPIVTAHSGLPFTLTSGSDENGDGVNSDRPDFIPGVPTSIGHPSRAAAAAEWFNTAAFCPNNGASTAAACAGVTGIGPNGQDGNVGRDSMFGPAFIDADLSISRDFQIHENLVLQLRGEALNAFNIVNLGQPGTTFGSATFGVISGICSACSMRELQVGARLTF